MNNKPNSAKLKQALKWLLLAFVLLLVLDWLLDGRLRQCLPGKRPSSGNNDTI